MTLCTRQHGAAKRLMAYDSSCRLACRPYDAHARACRGLIQRSHALWRTEHVYKLYDSANITSRIQHALRVHVLWRTKIYYVFKQLNVRRVHAFWRTRMYYAHAFYAPKCITCAWFTTLVSCLGTTCACMSYRGYQGECTDLSHEWRLNGNKNEVILWEVQSLGNE